MLRLFDILSREPETVSMAGGVASALARDGVTLFSVVERTELGKANEVEDLTERSDDVQDAMIGVHDPEAFAAELEALGGGDPEVAAKLIHERYRDVLGQVGEHDTVGRESVVQSFVEAFFFLPEQHQTSVLAQFLENQSEAPDRAFLDQFAGHELARMSSRLDPQAMSLLMDYANIVTDPEADARSGELLALLEAPEAVESARHMIASQVSEQWGSLVDSAETTSVVPIETPDPDRYFFTVLEVFRSLLQVESRDDRFGRLMRIWSGKLASSLRRGELRRSELWLRAVLDNHTYGEDRGAAVDAALDSVMRGVLVDHLIRYHEALEEITPLVRMMSVVGSRLGDPLIDRLAESEDAAERRLLTQLLAFVAAGDPQGVLRRLDDDRWFLVRNLATALRKSGRADSAPGLRSLLEHQDHRVRVEALRGVAVLEGSASLDVVAAALSDDDDGVRTAALAALGGLGGADAERRLVEALDVPTLSPEQRSRTIELIGRDPSPEARDLLVQLANRRFAMTANARLVREAARKALETSGGSA